MDGTPPTSTISSPTDGQTLGGSSYAISGTASDNVGVTAVEVSTNGGSSWTTATGTTSWSYNLDAAGECLVHHRGSRPRRGRQRPAAAG